MTVKAICFHIKEARTALVTVDVSTPEKHRNAIIVLDRFMRLMLAQLHLCVYTMGQVHNWDYLEQLRLLNKKEMEIIKVRNIVFCFNIMYLIRECSSTF